MQFLLRLFGVLIKIVQLPIFVIELSLFKHISKTIIGTVSETLCYKIISMCICTNERFGVSE
jgi:hypothetical protein